MNVHKLSPRVHYWAYRHPSRSRLETPLDMAINYEEDMVKLSWYQSMYPSLEYPSLGIQDHSSHRRRNSENLHVEQENFDPLRAVPSSRPNLLRRYNRSIRPSLNLGVGNPLAEDMHKQVWTQRLRLSNPLIRETLSEFLGMFLLILIGNSIVANTVLNRMDILGNVVGPLGWGFTVALVVMVTGGASGAHVNPAVTLALATVGKCRWSRVLPFFAAQYLGAFVASAVLFGVYRDAFDNFDGGVRIVWDNVNATGHVFATYPQPFVSTTTCFFDQIVGTCLLLVAVSGLGDERNMKIPVYLHPIFMCFAIASIIIGFNYNCQAAINPARDLGPRIFSAMAGWGSGVFSYRNYNWFWVPVVGPHLGGILGVWIYRLALELHWPPLDTPTPAPLQDDFKVPWKPTHMNGDTGPSLSTSLPDQPSA